jgi:hypothetical protein
LVLKHATNTSNTSTTIISTTNTSTTTATTSVRSSPFFSASVSASAQLSMAAAIMKFPQLAQDGGQNKGLRNIRGLGFQEGSRYGLVGVVFDADTMRAETCKVMRGTGAIVITY